jgi:hypothetical protein
MPVAVALSLKITMFEPVTMSPFVNVRVLVIVMLVDKVSAAALLLFIVTLAKEVVEVPPSVLALEPENETVLAVFAGMNVPLFVQFP